MNYISVVLICGIPAVGKSTMARGLCEEIKGKGDEEVMLMEFDMIEKVDENNYSEFQLMRDDYLRRFIEELGKNGNGTGKVIVLDDNFYLKSMRKKFYQETCRYLKENKESMRVNYCEVFIHCECDIAIEMNKKREEIRRVPNEVIEKMYKEFEYNSPYIIKDENQLCYHQKYSSINESSYKTLIAFIINADLLPHLIDESAIEHIQPDKNQEAIFIDNLELLLRKGIALKIKEAKVTTGKEISIMKKAFMKTITQLLSNTLLPSHYESFSIKDISSILNNTTTPLTNKQMELVEYFLSLIK